MNQNHRSPLTHTPPGCYGLHLGTLCRHLVYFLLKQVTTRLNFRHTYRDLSVVGKNFLLYVCSFIFSFSIGLLIFTSQKKHVLISKYYHFSSRRSGTVSHYEKMSDIMGKKFGVQPISAIENITLLIKEENV